MNQTLRSGFPPPPLHPPSRRSLDLSPKAVNAWMESLPVGFPKASAEKILNQVHRINRLSIPEEQRLRFYLGLGRQTHSLLQTLHEKLRDVAAPPRKKEMELAQLVILLHLELALGYRNAFGWQASNKSGRKSPPATCSTLLNQALHHLCRSLKVHYLINFEPGKEIWEKIYALYAFAEEGGILAEASAPFPGRFAETVEDTFKTILLVSLSAPRSLHGAELDALWDLLPNLAPYTRLQPEREATGLESNFLIGLYSGQAPRIVAGKDRDRHSRASEYLSFEVAPLISEIRHRLKPLRHHKQADGFHPDANHPILKHLKSRLGPQRKRRSKRIAEEFTVDVIAGFHDVYHFLSGGKAIAGSEDPSANNRKHDPRSPHTSVNYDVVLNLEQVSIKTQNEFEDDVDHKATPPFAEEKLDVRLAPCKTLNFSSGGYCLITDSAKGFRLKARELIALREGNKDRWLPGNITWITSDGHRLQFGVNLMAPFCLPGKALCSRVQETQSTDCLLLFNDLHSPPVKILLSSTCNLEHTTLAVEYGGKHLEITLQKRLANTPGYMEFQCDASSPRGDDEKTIPLFGDTQEQ